MESVGGSLRLALCGSAARRGRTLKGQSSGERFLHRQDDPRWIRPAVVHRVGRHERLGLILEWPELIEVAREPGEIARRHRDANTMSRQKRVVRGPELD